MYWVNGFAHINAHIRHAESITILNYESSRNGEGGPVFIRASEVDFSLRESIKITRII